jgi:D-3-phosphoglycerate dehydrogenase
LSVAALVCGRLEQDRFPGRNMLPLLGRPMMVYPLLAAQHSRYVDVTYLSTDSPLMASVAANYGVQTIQRPAQLCQPDSSWDDIINHGFQYIQQTHPQGQNLEALLILLCNAPTITASLIDEGIEKLLADSSLDSLISVTLHEEHHPRYALSAKPDGLLTPILDRDNLSQTQKLAYFGNNDLVIVRPRNINRTVAKNFPIPFAGERVAPLIHEGYGDIDYPWQVPAVEQWLQKHQFSETLTPYDDRKTQTQPSPLESSSLFSVPVPKTPLERRVLITTVPFGEIDRKPLDLLEANDIEYVINPIGRKLKEPELAELIQGFGVVIAGTEPNTAKVIANGAHLRLISRVGIGLDSVDLHAARERGILVSYTPDAPAPAVAELTVGMMLSLLRNIAQTDRGMRNGVWRRYMGLRLADMTIGIIGVGRVGKKVIKHLQGFGSRIIANDIQPDFEFGYTYGITWADKEKIYQEADIISLHVPLTPDTHYLIDTEELQSIKPGAMLINTSRGSIVREPALVEALRSGQLGSAAIDVFEQEPYSGELVTLENCLLTCHMGSCSRDCRSRMEIEATEEAIRFLKGEPLLGLVPELEYDLQKK